MDSIEFAASVIMGISKYGYFDAENGAMRLDWESFWNDMLKPAYICTQQNKPYFDSKALSESFGAYNYDGHGLDNTSRINKKQAEIMLDELEFNFNPDDPVLHERQRELALYQAFRRLQRPNWKMLARSGLLDELETPERLKVDE